MTKESIYELQKIDCNCNDCFFLQRDTEKYYAQVELDKANQQILFDNKKSRAIEEANKKIKRGDKERGELALKAALSLKHSYQGDVIPLLYGDCKKYKKPISFHPNILQLETQECFVHRKDKAAT